jgi:2-enoate reductase
LKKLERKKKLLVVGAGPAGIEAARVGVERGFDVSLWEGQDCAGGNLVAASAPPFKNDIAAYRDYLRGLLGRLPVDVQYGREATVDSIQDYGADYVVVATGADMEAPPVAGSKVFGVIDVLLGCDVQADTLVMMGAGVIGCETALWLAQQGKKVFLCARSDGDELDISMVDLHNRSMLLRMIQHPNITIHRATIPVSFDKGVVHASCGSETLQLPADSLVFAGRMFPVNALAQALQGASNVFAVGDCLESGSIMDAVWSSFHAVRTIECKE